MKNDQQGFTLIEVMIVVVIVGILSAIAYPAYEEHVRKGNRAEARAVLLNSAQALERYYSINGTYLDGGSLAKVYPDDISSGSKVRYSLGVTTETADSYVLNATGEGNMASDDCGTYSINHTGVLSSTSTAAKCL
ncbi:MAG TPA: prepilin-type N-terminal cleavage/methylation domain-containing protein [Pseudomonas xinjiangensis]|uniref:Prepilin-type N-terminal cleavage/methylation domain-containing protein n=2 Tax=root TaxID=1 RepID=A0A7V1FRQ1_9GAMM|nr:prepilin-type N-terminal cleavage/methylation domain-containing protein [Halopseudomonas xinjiangensis]HEC48697.1 prepilin-type N-terminal cleavage/methylation domain-containing protein [Halopseudomonas xinjiangensis]